MKLCCKVFNTIELLFVTQPAFESYDNTPTINVGIVAKYMKFNRVFLSVEGWTAADVEHCWESFSVNHSRHNVRAVARNNLVGTLRHNVSRWETYFPTNAETMHHIARQAILIP